VTAGSDAHGFAVNRPPKPTAAQHVMSFLELILERWEGRMEAPGPFAIDSGPSTDLPLLGT
jgi:hypothetical protein